MAGVRPVRVRRRKGDRRRSAAGSIRVVEITDTCDTRMGIANAGNVPVTAETEITLAFGSQRAVVSPFGVSLRRYFLLEDNREVNTVWD